MLDKGAKLWEVAKSVTLLPMGVVVGASHVYNPDFWQSLQPAERRILLDAMAPPPPPPRAPARAQVAYHLSVQAALDGARKRGIELLAPSDDLKASLAAFNKASIANLPKAAMAARKIADPSDLIRAYLGLEAKWKGLLQGVDRGDEDAVFKVLDDNLYTQIHASRFGL